MFHHSFKTLYWRQFESIRQGAEFFHVSKQTITRWLDGTVPINPMAEKLLLIKSLGYLPNDIRKKASKLTFLIEHIPRPRFISFRLSANPQHNSNP